MVKKSNWADIENFLQAGVIPAYFVSIFNVKTGEIFLRESNVAANAVFDLASLTKPLATANFIFQEKKLEEDIQVLGENLSVRSLLSHTSGLPAWLPIWMNQDVSSKQDIVLRALRRSWSGLGKKQFLYSDLGYMLLDIFLDEKTGKTLDQMFASRYPNLSIGFPSQLGEQNYVSTGTCPFSGKELVGVVQDDNCRLCGNGVMGHAGLFGSGDGVTNLLLQMASENSQFFEQNYRLIDASVDGLLGMRKATQSAPTFIDGGSMGHLGWTGTGFWLDWPSGLTYVLLTNRVISGRLCLEPIQKVRWMLSQYVQDHYVYG